LIWIWSAGQVLGGDAEAARGDLLDRERSESPAFSGDVGLDDGRRRSRPRACRLRRSPMPGAQLVAVARRSSPPSPVFDLPPMRFIAIASVVCASVEIDPSDIAPVAKRLTISLAGSTSSSGTPCTRSSGTRTARAASCGDATGR
jgi:hypothetical protein